MRGIPSMTCILCCGPTARNQPDREDHIDAAGVRHTCRRNGIQIGTIDAVLIQLCLRHDLVLLSTDHDFQSASKQIKFRLWRGVA